MLLTLGAHAQRGLQYSVCLSVCLSVCYNTPGFSCEQNAEISTSMWILLTMLASRDMANFVSQEAYER